MAARDWDPTYRAAAVASLGWWEPLSRSEVLLSNVAVWGIRPVQTLSVSHPYAYEPKQSMPIDAQCENRVVGIIAPGLKAGSPRCQVEAPTPTTSPSAFWKTIGSTSWS